MGGALFCIDENPQTEAKCAQPPDAQTPGGHLKPTANGEATGSHD